jgi:Serpin (serine protease inhibitor)/Putative zinc finger in N-recognin (UBR box)
MKLYSCTNQQNGTEYVEQEWRNCFTCDPSTNKGVCIPCSEKCHAGHTLGPVRCSTFFCDCGVGALTKQDECACYIVSETDIILRALSDNMDGTMIEKQMAMSRIYGITSPHTVYLCLGLMASVYDCADVTKSFTGGNDILLLYSKDHPGIKTGIGLFGSNTGATFPDMDIDLHVDSRNSTEVINAFVAEKTDNMLSQLFDSDPGKNQICVSVLVLDMKWEYEFDEDMTTEIEFTGRGGDTQISVMRRFPSERTLCMMNDKFLSIVLTYSNETFAILTLPSDGADIQKHIDENQELYHQHLNMKNIMAGNGYIAVPKFKKDYSYPSFENDLASIGFDIETFRARTGVDKIVHKVVIEMNEAGTKAPASGALSLEGTRSDFEWVGDVPYALAIVGKNDPNRSGTLLFYGIVDHSV